MELLLHEQGLRVTGVVIVFALLVKLYQGLFNPLAKVPGPWYSKWTDLADQYHAARRDRHVWVQSLHDKYGPIVRTAPDRVYVADPAAAQRIHRIKGEFRKAPIYNKLFVGAPNIVSTTEPEVHRRFRRLLSGPISESGLKAVLPEIESKVRLAVQLIGEEMKDRGAADIWKWWLFMATDVIGELSFGESFRMLEYKKINQYARDLQTLDSLNALRVTFPSLYWLGGVMPISKIRESQKFMPRLFGYAAQSIERHRTLAENGDANVRQTLLQKAYAASADASMTWEELLSNARSYLVAGSDTTSNTLTWLAWAVCKHPGVQRRLAAEVGALPPGFAHDDVRRLPYLNQVIEEALRLYPAVPAGLPRSVPPEGVTFGKTWLPGGTTVLAQAYSLHRDPVAFPDAEAFDPSRWENPTQAMRASFYPFGGGSRICIGLHLAYIEMRLAVAHFFREFPNATVSTLEGMCDDDMVQDAFFLGSPRGHRCLIQSS